MTGKRIAVDESGGDVANGSSKVVDDDDHPRGGRSKKASRPEKTESVRRITTKTTTTSGQKFRIDSLAKPPTAFANRKTRQQSKSNACRSSRLCRSRPLVSLATNHDSTSSVLTTTAMVVTAVGDSPTLVVTTGDKGTFSLVFCMKKRVWAALGSKFFRPSPRKRRHG